jgi:hypothetical protein
MNPRLRANNGPKPAIADRAWRQKRTLPFTAPSDDIHWPAIARSPRTSSSGPATLYRPSERQPGRPKDLSPALGIRIGRHHEAQTPDQPRETTRSCVPVHARAGMGPGISFD